MEIEILGTESLGVRGLSSYIKTKVKKILIDPGIALGYSRFGLLPHPFQVAVGDRIRKIIIERWVEATDIVFSHFHGDHVPLVQANPYQLSIFSLRPLKPQVKIWIRSADQPSQLEKSRFSSLQPFLGKNFYSIDYQSQEVLFFSKMVFHGERNINRNKVFMTCIKDDFIFVHGSDIQLLDEEAIQVILSWKPDLLLVSGPPLYLYRKMNHQYLEEAEKNALILSEKISTVIIDHHLLRSFQGLDWLKSIHHKSKNRVICAAEYMKKPIMMLEADRLRLYQDMTVPSNWHEKYAQGLIDPQKYWQRGAINRSRY